MSEHQDEHQDEDEDRDLSSNLEEAGRIDEEEKEDGVGVPAIGLQM